MKKNIIFSFLLIFILLLLFSSFVFANESEIQLFLISTPTPTNEVQHDENEQMLPEYWKWWEVYPDLSETALSIYNDAIDFGRNPNAFSVIGDCQSEPNIFMGRFDRGDYTLPEKEKENLSETISYFEGSFDRDSITVKDGLSVSSVFVPLWNDPEQCNSDETPLNCEIRLNNPSIFIISLGTNWKPGYQDAFEEQLRALIDFSIENHVLPILATKADNVEGDESINRTIANLAYEYDIPLWNFWFTVQTLPNHGIDETRGENQNLYLIPNAWDVKSFSGLRLLDKIRIAVSK